MYKLLCIVSFSKNMKILFYLYSNKGFKKDTFLLLNEI